MYKRLFSLKNPYPLAAFLSLIYWIYLFYNSHMLISADAVGYERLAQLIQTEGWIKYFQTGPNREPLYPFLISLSMRGTDVFAINYQSIQKIFQILILLFTQFLLYKTLCRLKIHNTITAWTLLYFGFSPTIVNSAFSLYSEIITYPLLMGILLASAAAWQHLLDGKHTRVISSAAYISILFILITCVKAIFEYIFLIYLVPFLILLGLAVVKQKKQLATRSALFIVVTAAIFQSFLFSYKSLNHKYNGHFTLTDRGAWLFYGNTSRRLEPLTARRFLSCLTSIPGAGVCRAVFSEEECNFWDFRTADGRGWGQMHELQRQGITSDKMDTALIATAKQLILKNPVQYIILAATESIKMFFWESTKIGFVAYPEWLSRLYEFTLFKNGLRLLVSVLTATACLHSIGRLWRFRQELFIPSQNQNTYMICFLATLTCGYIAMYSLVSIVVRFTVPLAPFYLMSIAYYTHNMFSGPRSGAA